MIGCTGNSLSAKVAMHIANIMGIQNLYFYAFDACLNKNTGYAKKIGYLPDLAGSPKRFLGHRVILESTAKLLGQHITFVPIQ